MKPWLLLVPSTTHIFTKDFCPRAAQAVVRAPNDGGVAFITLPCPVSLIECWPACPGVVLSLGAMKRGRKNLVNICWFFFKNEQTAKSSYTSKPSFFRVLIKDYGPVQKMCIPLYWLDVLPEEWSVTADTVIHPHFKMVQVDPTKGLRTSTNTHTHTPDHNVRSRNTAHFTTCVFFSTLVLQVYTMTCP